MLPDVRLLVDGVEWAIVHWDLRNNLPRGEKTMTVTAILPELPSVVPLPMTPEQVRKELDRILDEMDQVR